MDTEAQTPTPIDWTKPIETEDELPARIISEDFRIEGGETVKMVQIEYHHKSVLRLFFHDGKPRYSYEGRIRNRKTKREGWINIFGGQWVGSLHKSEEAARLHPNVEDAIATIKIEWEE